MAGIFKFDYWLFFKDHNYILYLFIIIFLIEASLGAGAQCVTVKSTGCGFKIFIYISSLWCRGNARR